MPIINKYSQIIIVALLIVVIILAALLITKNGSNVPSSPAASSTTASANIPAGTQTATKPAPTTPVMHPASGGSTSATKIHILTPVAGDIWTIAKQNHISWDKQAGVSGQIELLDAATLKLVGVILNETGPLQTYYDWNTRDLLVARTNPAKIIVTQGKYWSGSRLTAIIFRLLRAPRSPSWAPLNRRLLNKRAAAKRFMIADREPMRFVAHADERRLCNVPSGWRR